MKRWQALALTLLAVALLAGCGARTDDLFSATGRITDLRGAGAQGVHLVAQEGLATTVTGATGVWRLDGLRGAVTIVPSRPGSEFLPPSHRVLPQGSGAYFTIVTPIMGQPVATKEQARQWLALRVPNASYLALVDLYYEIAPIYGVRPDVALAQAVHETGSFRFGGLVQPWQNNWAGIGATGVASDGNTPLHGADPTRVRFEAGLHGAIFADAATGVEAQIQHLYAYATTQPLPAGRVLLSPRFNLVRRGTARYVEHLGAAQNPAGTGWATDPNYGFKILANALTPLTQAAR